MIRKAINMIRHWCNCRLKCKFSTLFILFSYDFDFYLISVFIFCCVSQTEITVHVPDGLWYHHHDIGWSPSANSAATKCFR